MSCLSRRVWCDREIYREEAVLDSLSSNDRVDRLETSSRRYWTVLTVRQR